MASLGDEIGPAYERKVAIVGDCFIDIVTLTGDKDIPGWGQSLKCDEPILPHAGGSALNTASHLSSITGESLRWNLSLYTATGEDIWEEIIKNHCTECGLELHNTKIHSSSTAVCLALSTVTKQSFISHKGAVAQFSREHINVDELSKYDHIHFGGVKATLKLQEDLPGLVEELRCKNSSITFSLNINGGLRFDWSLELLKQVDVFVQNAEESLKISGKDSVDEALDWFALRVKKVVIITLGAEGAIGLEVSTMKKIKVGCAETSTRVIDTTGCGDAFVAGFLVSWIGNAEPELEKALIHASRAAAFISHSIGACTRLLSYGDLVDSTIHVPVKRAINSGGNASSLQQ